jgi:ADP-ribosylglycohydrolase
MREKEKGMVFGSFVGDAMALGTHWVYNTHVIDKKFGRVEQYLDPLASYHSGKKKGDLTHYGDQTLMLLESVSTSRAYDRSAFAQAWQSFFDDYPGYRDKATQTTLKNMSAGNNILESGSTSDDLGGAARMAPVLYAHAQDVESAIQAARHQTSLSHNNPSVLDASDFFVRLTFSALSGQKPSVAIPALLENQFKDTDLAESASLGLASQNKDTRAVIAEFGQMCSVEAAFPGVIHLIVSYEDNFKEALVENVMAGGDSAARGMFVGMILGAYLGIDAVPEEWIERLNARKRIDELLSSIDRK